MKSLSAILRIGFLEVLYMKKWNKLLPLLPAYFIIIALCLFIGIGGSRVLTAMSDSAAFTERHTIILDAGHGGEDGGATSCTGILESSYNLDITRRLNDLLHLMGFKTKMIRTTDISVYTQGSTIAEKKVSDLKERARIANTTENGIFVSIHQNYFTQAQYSGAQVFYNNHPDSKIFAQNLQTIFVNNLNIGSNRTAKKADSVYLMKKVNCPAILIECGFLSNTDEEALLRSVGYQKNLCCVIATGISQHLSSRKTLS